MPRQLRAREGEEIWETTTDGRIWVPITDDRGREQTVSVGGKAGSRLRIRAVDREIAQDRVLENDPFTNGLLVRVDASQQDDPRTASEDVMTTEELLLGFSKNGNAFRSFVDKLSEVNTRRMKDMAEMVDASASQTNYLDQVIKEKYRVDGDTPTYREMRAAREV